LAAVEGYDIIELVQRCDERHDTRIHKGVDFNGDHRVGILVARLNHLPNVDAIAVPGNE
jgi:hypothetical protein